ncbi:MAG: DUF4824 family protein [Sulfurifustis sp.]
MIAWSRKRTLVAGVVLIVATNAVALAGVAYNRSGEPSSVLKLTERELALPYSWGFAAENSGIALNLRWRVSSGRGTGGRWYYRSGGSPGWLDKEKLAALGFDVSKPVETSDGERHYEQLLGKEALLVLELDGPAYQSALEQVREHLRSETGLAAANPGKKEFKARAEEAAKALTAEERSQTRLFVVDAGLERDALRARYPDRVRYAIVRGQVTLSVLGTGANRRLGGYVSDLSIEAVHVPLAYRGIFEPLMRAPGRVDPPAEPRYDVTLAFGKRLEPWLLDASVHAKR